MQKDIRTESRAVWDFILGILKFPFLIFLAVKNKGSYKDSFVFLHSAGRFFLEPKGTVTLVVINTAIYFYFVLTQIPIEPYLWHSHYLFSNQIINMFPAMFLHASFLHLFGNMLFLYILGRVVEKELGTNKFFTVYFIAGIVSFIVDSAIRIFLFNQSISALGASGAISGIAAMALLLRPLYSTYLLFGLPIPIVFVVFLQIMKDVTGVLVPDGSNIGYLAHVGGYLSIFVISSVLTSEQRKQIKRGLLLALLILLAVFLLNFYVQPLWYAKAIRGFL